MNAMVNRRSWLKRSALTAGGVMTGIAMVPDLLSKPAFGMSPLNANLLYENYNFDSMLQDRESIKARLSANENPWGPSKKAVEAIAENAAKGNRYVYNSSRKMVDLLAAKEGVGTDQIL